MKANFKTTLLVVLLSLLVLVYFAPFQVCCYLISLFCGIPGPQHDVQVCCVLFDVVFMLLVLFVAVASELVVLVYSFFVVCV